MPDLILRGGMLQLREGLADVAIEDAQISAIGFRVGELAKGTAVILRDGALGMGERLLPADVANEGGRASAIGLGLDELAKDPVAMLRVGTLRMAEELDADYVEVEGGQGSAVDRALPGEVVTYA